MASSASGSRKKARDISILSHEATSQLEEASGSPGATTPRPPIAAEAAKGMSLRTFTSGLDKMKDEVQHCFGTLGRALRIRLERLEAVPTREPEGNFLFSHHSARIQQIEDEHSHIEDDAEKARAKLEQYENALKHDPSDLTSKDLRHIVKLLMYLIDLLHKDIEAYEKSAAQGFVGPAGE